MRPLWSLAVAATCLVGCGSETGAPVDRSACDATLVADRRGLEAGQFMPLDLSWQGYRLDTTNRTLRADEYWDCDGSKGIDALVIDVAGFG